MPERVVGPLEVRSRVRSLSCFLRVPGEPWPVVLFEWPDGGRWLYSRWSFVPMHDWPLSALVTAYDACGVRPAFVRVECGS